MVIPSVKLLNMLETIHWITELAKQKELSPQEASRLHSEVQYLEKDIEDLCHQIDSMEKKIQSMEKEISDMSYDVIIAKTTGEEKRRRSHISIWIMLLIGGMLLFWIWRVGQ